MLPCRSACGGLPPLAADQPHQSEDLRVRHLAFCATRLAEAPLWIGLCGIGIMMSLNTIYYTLLGLILTRDTTGRRGMDRCSAGPAS